MAIREIKATELTISIDQFTDKAAIRNYLLQQWIIETPSTRYRYFVDMLTDGSRLYLYRPAPYNKGCDFVIYVENLFLYGNGNDKPPSFKDLLTDLVQKSETLTAAQVQSLKNAIQDIYDVRSFQTAIQHLQGVPEIGLPFETILKLLKWFFAEQDLTYWSGTGRTMLLNYIKDEI